MKNVYYLPESVDRRAIQNMRKAAGLSQSSFAELLRVSKSTIERWETEDGEIRGPIVMLSYLLRLHPEYLADLIVPEQKTELRLWYMHQDTLCSLIDVDEVRQRVEVRNYTDNIFFKAFGPEEHPSWQNYLDFLKSRCFPEERDGMKMILRNLGIPFYDPMLIIEKTEGRMEEDQFWIRIERDV